MTLLNNWENTYFKFNEELLTELMKEAKHLGVDMFLLDDGWFGNKHPRNSDNAGLGDWEVMRSKLPGGIPALVQSAKEAGVIPTGLSNCLTAKHIITVISWYSILAIRKYRTLYMV